MLTDKRNNPRLDFGITVVHNHKRRMSKDISTYIKINFTHKSQTISSPYPLPRLLLCDIGEV